MKNPNDTDLQAAVEEIQESIRILGEKQNAQYTEIALKLNEIKQFISWLEVDEETGTIMLDKKLEAGYENAKKIVVESGKASTSWIQRKLGIGYSQAARLIDELEQKGVIGPANGSKPREVLVKE